MSAPELTPRNRRRPDLASRLSEGTCLVVDDHGSMRKVTINQLRQLGATKFIEAANGAEALKILSSQPITFVLSDWNMPMMSGLELLLAIRADPKLFSLPFLMITAEAERERVALAVRSGVSDLLVKPYTAGRLAVRIEKLLDWKPHLNQPIDPEFALAHSHYQLSDKTTPPPSASNTQGPKPAHEKPTILVVDDTPDNLALLSSIFKNDYRVKIAHSGEMALRICHSDTPPDLILLDIMMPDMDGFEVARQLRGHPSSEHIPVIFVTAMTGEEARFKGMELGAVDFFTKPINPDALKIRVRNFMRYIELHRQLQADYDNMMAVERLKQDVESITRHDMKAPLAGVIGIVQSLGSETNLTEAQREMLHLAEETALQALDMINLSNELYKIETGGFELKPASVLLADILRRVASLQRKAFAVKKLNIVVATAHGMTDDQLVATGDAMLCYSLFQNLFKNACEAAPENSTVTATLTPAENQLKISIENQGTVPPSIRDTFFEKFATAGKQGGTGLGTYSAKLLTEAQNGTITMETSDDQNETLVCVNLPKATSLC